MNKLLPVISAATLCLLLNLSIPAHTALAGQLPASPADRSQAEDVTCKAVLERAYTTLQTSCSDVGRNQACYGNDRIQAKLTDSNVNFQRIGDIAAIQAIKELTTLPLDSEQGTWGLALLKLQANLPDTLPGQNVTFLVYGDVSIQNSSGNMRAFYFSSGLGNLKCTDAPGSGILVHAPSHTEVTFTANGVQFTIASTVVLHAQPNKSMDVTLIEGHARLSTPMGIQTLQPGQTTSIALSGGNGLEAASAPSSPSVLPPSPSLPALLTVGSKVAKEAALSNVVIDGCISDLKDGIATINDQQVNLQGTSGRGARIGDCLRIKGNVDANGQSDPVIKATNSGPSVSSTPLPNTKGNGQGNNGNGNGNAGGNGNGNGGNGNGNNGGGNRHGNNANGKGNGGGNGQGNNGNGNGNGGGNGSNGGGNGKGNNGNGNGNGGGKKS